MTKLAFVGMFTYHILGWLVLTLTNSHIVLFGLLLLATVLWDVLSSFSIHTTLIPMLPFTVQQEQVIQRPCSTVDVGWVVGQNLDRKREARKWVSYPEGFLLGYVVGCSWFQSCLVDNVVCMEVETLFERLFVADPWNPPVTSCQNVLEVKIALHPAISSFIHSLSNLTSTNLTTFLTVFVPLIWLMIGHPLGLNESLTNLQLMVVILPPLFLRVDIPIHRCGTQWHGRVYLHGSDDYPPHHRIISQTSTITGTQQTNVTWPT